MEISTILRSLDTIKILKNISILFFSIDGAQVLGLLVVNPVEVTVHNSVLYYARKVISF